MFETERKNTTQEFKKMIVFNRKGEFIEDVYIPEEIQDMPHYELDIENDSLFLKETQFEKTTFVLGRYVTDFIKTKTREFKFFHDSTYNVFRTCNGEFGGTIYFQNKRTKDAYEACATCPIVVNKISNEYYVTNYLGHMIGFASVIKVKDPAQLQKSELRFEKEQGSEFKKGIETLIDTMEFYIPTSFVLGNKLLHLYSNRQGTYLGEIDGGKMKLVYEFDFKFYAHLNQRCDDGKQVLSLYMPDTEKSGILIIDKNKMNFYLIK
jgi:hypothetical protein